MSSLEPSPGADPGCPSIPGRGGRRSEGREFREQDSNLRAPGPKPGRDASNPSRNAEPPFGADPNLAPYRDAVTAVCSGRPRNIQRALGPGVARVLFKALELQGKSALPVTLSRIFLTVCPRGFEPPQPLRTTATSAPRVYLFRHGHMRAATQCRTEPPAVRRRGRKPCAAACISIQLPGLDSNQRGQGSEPCWGRQRPTRNRVRETGSEPARALRPTGVWARHVCIPSLPHGAPRGQRSPTILIKSQVLCQLS